MIDWTDPDCQVTPNFTVRDCLWLAHWGRLATEDDGFDSKIESEILRTVAMAEQVRAVLKIPMIVTSLYRPAAYSPIVGGSATDVHTKGVAIDFTTIPGMEIEDAKALLRSNLTSLDIRMEKGTTDWIHLDTWKVGPSGREFTP